MAALLVIVCVILTAAHCESRQLQLDIQPPLSLSDHHRISSRDYVAAVLEMAPRPGDVDANLYEIRNEARRAAEQHADILVTPEYAIVGSEALFNRSTCVQAASRLPPLNEDTAPCDDDQQQHTVPQHLSCIAKDHRIYLVANLIELQPCEEEEAEEECPEDGVEVYNTNVVFDRDGRLIQRYRKQHLFGPELAVMQTPRDNHLAVFRTDFGVQFGVFTCFDILFESPAVDLVHAGVRHFAFPTAWADELPFLTAVQAHSGWAVGQAVTLLSANRRRLPEGGVSSGVYNTAGAGHTFITYTSNTCVNQRNTLVISHVPATREHRHSVQVEVSQPLSSSVLTPVRHDHCTSDRDDMYVLQHYDLKEFSSQPLEPHAASQRQCAGSLCCQLTRISEDTTGETATLRLMAFSGHRTTVPHWSTDVCALVRCRTGQQHSCNQQPETPPAVLQHTSAVKYRLCATFESEAVVFVSVMDADMQLADKWQYDRSDRCVTFVVTPRTYVAQMYARTFSADRTSVEQYRRHWLDKNIEHR